MYAGFLASQEDPYASHVDPRTAHVGWDERKSRYMRGM